MAQGAEMLRLLTPEQRDAVLALGGKKSPAEGSSSSDLGPISQSEATDSFSREAISPSALLAPRRAEKTFELHGRVFPHELRRQQ